MSGIDRRLLERSYQASGGDRWGVSIDAFAIAVDRSIAKSFANRDPSPADLDRFVSALHVADLALAIACAAGHEGAWDHFVGAYRPVLYRMADALDRTGGARELADAIYAELFGLKEGQRGRRSLFDYFHGRSSLATWLRAVLAQRRIDGARVSRRLEPLDETVDPPGPRTAATAETGERVRFVTLFTTAFTAALAALVPRDRLRLGCYYAQEMTLAAIGRLVGEHEATVSRQLARTRRELRRDVERRLRADARLTEAELAECFASMSADPGGLDLRALLPEATSRKNPALDRSPGGGVS